MKFNEVDANFRRMDFHKPTASKTGHGIQMKGTLDGKLQMQIAKQATENTRTEKATYFWTDKDKSTMFILDASEIRELILLIRKALKGKAILFDKDKHDKMTDNPEYDRVKKFHSNGNNGSKTIIFLPKEYRNEIQIEMDIFVKKNGKSTSFMYSFDKNEMIQLEMVLSIHQARELPIPEGFMSVILNSDREVLRKDYMPQLSVGDYIVIDKDSYEIKKKTFVTKKNLLVYSV